MFHPMLAAVDPWIVSLSALTVLVTVGMGFWAAGRAKSASDFFVAGRGVSVGWNASAIWVNTSRPPRSWGWRAW